MEYRLRGTINADKFWGWFQRGTIFWRAWLSICKPSRDVCKLVMLYRRRVYFFPRSRLFIFLLFTRYYQAVVSLYWTQLVRVLCSCLIQSFMEIVSSLGTALLKVTEWCIYHNKKCLFANLPFLGNEQFSSKKCGISRVLFSSFFDWKCYYTIDFHFICFLFT